MSVAMDASWTLSAEETTEAAVWGVGDDEDGGEGIGATPAEVYVVCAADRLEDVEDEGSDVLLPWKPSLPSSIGPAAALAVDS